MVEAPSAVASTRIGASPTAALADGARPLDVGAGPDLDLEGGEAALRRVAGPIPVTAGSPASRIALHATGYGRAPSRRQTGRPPDMAREVVQGDVDRGERRLRRHADVARQPQQRSSPRRRVLPISARRALEVARDGERRGAAAQAQRHRLAQAGRPSSA